MRVEPIAYIRTVYDEKFGVPRQAGLVESEAEVVMRAEYGMAEAVRGLEGFDYVWLIWGCHLNDDVFRPTVRPPRMGGNARMGVFATRSPFHPNRLGLSAVRLVEVTRGSDGVAVLRVTGADMVDGTPIYDIKPYVAYADSHPEARCGFAQERPRELRVTERDDCLAAMPEGLRKAVVQSVANDPRPQYHHDATRRYALSMGGWTVRFVVDGDEAEIVGCEKNG